MPLILQKKLLYRDSFYLILYSSIQAPCIGYVEFVDAENINKLFSVYIHNQQ